MKHSLYRSRNSFAQVDWQMVEILDGDVTAAVLFDWIAWKVEGPQAHVDDDGRTWLVAGRRELSEETHISEKAIRTALAKLVNDGHIEKANPKLKGNYDRTTAYAPIWEPLAPEGQSSGPVGPISLAPRGQSSSIEDIEDITLIEDEVPTSVKTIDEHFAGFWSAYPRKVDRKAAHQNYTRALTKLSPMKRELLAARITAALPAHIALWKAEGREPKLIPHAATWISHERWNDELKPIAAPTSLAERYAGRNIL